MSSFTPLKEWGATLSSDGLMHIAGPCAAESETQVMETATALAREPLAFFRAGVWKPRTRPGTFEGVGETALPWLLKAREKTGMKIAIEVANAKHVRLALDHGLDAIWVGARTSVTPFAVQEIADSLNGQDIPVFVKNPINPDLELWIGAIERLRNSGIRRIAAVLRGCSGIAPGRFRNAPAWQMAFELKRRLPGIPCLCDPSHITGNTSLIQEVAQQALNLDFDGLMVEVHAHPSDALSDSFQQLTPEQFHAMLASLVSKKHDNDGSSEAQKRLAELRVEIDQLDTTLITTLARRMTVSQSIGQVKKDNNLAVLQSNRWEQVLAHVIHLGEQVGLEPDFVRDIFNRIHMESIQQQQ